MKTRKTSRFIYFAAAFLFAAIGQNSANAQSLTGTCSGTVTQNEPAPHSYSVTMKLMGNTGTIEYPALGCGGSLTFIKSDDSVYFYKEHITHGIDKCVDGGTIEIVLQKNAVNWLWYNGTYTAYCNLTGKLTVSGLPQKRVPLGQEGFTHKYEAKNIIQDNLKTGKWIYYLDSNWNATDSNAAVYYRLMVYKAGQPIGIVRDYYRSGRLQNDYVFNSPGKKNGMAKWYYESGELSLAGSYTDSLWSGPFIWFYANGNPKEILFYTLGKANGIGLWFYESGSLSADIPFKDANRNGLARWFYESGKLEEEKNYTNGKADGELKMYNESGILTADIPYSNGNRNGTAKWYYDDGKLKQQSSYTDDQMNGIEDDYTENGTLSEETPWVNGQIQGLIKYYYESGKLQGEANWSDGKMNGSAKYYFESGGIMKSANFTNDLKNGIVQFYYESGGLKEEDTYVNDVLDGYIKWYYENGKMKAETIYSNGVAGQTYYWDENGNPIQ